MIRGKSKDCKVFQCPKLLENNGPIALEKRVRSLPRVTNRNERLEKSKKNDENDDTVNGGERELHRCL